MEKKYGIGIDLGGTTCKLGLFQTEGTLLEKWEIPTDKSDGGTNILPDIADAVEMKLIERSIEKTEVTGIGIGVPGAVDADGIVHRCVNLGWGFVNVQSELTSLTGLPVCVANDASIAALGESWKGSGVGMSGMLLITLGTGIGGGVSKAGEILLRWMRPGFEKAVFHACKTCNILLASLGNDAGIYGGMKVVLESGNANEMR